MSDPDSDKIERQIQDLARAVHRSDQVDGAVNLALDRLADGWGLDSALRTVSARFGSQIAEQAERKLADALLRHYGRR